MSIGLSVQKKQKKKKKISRWWPWQPSCILDQKYFSYFYQQVTLMHHTKFQVNWPFGSEEEAKNRLSRWLPLWPPWIPDQNHFIYFLIYKSSRCFLLSFKSIGPLVQKRKRKIDFQDGGHGCHLGFRIRTILAIFDLQVTPILSIKFRVNWPFCSGEDDRKKFSRWWAWQSSWISDQKDFSYF